MTGRRLFQSPSHVKLSFNQPLSLASKNATKLYSSKLEAIFEEPLSQMDNMSHVDRFNQAYNARLNNLDIVVDDDDMKGLSVFGHRSHALPDPDDDILFATPCEDPSSVHQNQFIARREQKQSEPSSQYEGQYHNAQCCG